jgi:hypothetical protein
MPNPVVREWFVDQVPKKTEVEFQETQGVLTNQKNLPEMWCTLEWDNGSRQRLTIGRRALWRENGACTVLFLAKSGKGPEALLEVAQAFADEMDPELGTELAEKSGIEGTLRIENVTPPNGEPYEDGNWLVASVTCIYTYDSVRGAGGE